jgi:4-diphosphocytidyl-2-C-methyl-D-erythritol kinase
MTGRGELLAESLPPAADLPLLLALPPAAPTSTAAVYHHFDVADTALQPTRDLTSLLTLLRNPATPALLEQLAGQVYNNLAAAACAVTPETAELLAFLQADPQVLAATVSGSGSACFALCNDASTVEHLARRTRAAGYWTQPTALAAQGITVANGA